MNPIVYHAGDFSYIRMSDLTEDVRRSFEAWIAYQTRPMLDGDPVQDAVYSWDWQRWLAAQSGGPVLWD